MAVRRALHRMGYRFRLHRRDLPGRPDLVLPRHRTVIFVHGCFWHGHDACCGNRTPKSYTDYWLPKLQRNRERDLENKAALKTLGWRVVVIWECETRKPATLDEVLRDRMRPTTHELESFVQIASGLSGPDRRA